MRRGRLKGLSFTLPNTKTEDTFYFCLEKGIVAYVINHRVHRDHRALRYFSVSSVLSVVFKHDQSYPCASASTVAPVDVAHTYGSRHTWRTASSAQSVFHVVCPCGDMKNIAPEIFDTTIKLALNPK
jgi:hypothetical protein